MTIARRLHAPNQLDPITAHPCNGSVPRCTLAAPTIARPARERATSRPTIAGPPICRGFTPPTVQRAVHGNPLKGVPCERATPQRLGAAVSG